MYALNNYRLFQLETFYKLIIYQKKKLFDVSQL